MQAYPLTLTNHLKRARAFFPDKQIVSKLEAGVFRYTYRDFAGRVAQLANVLRGLGIGQGDRVGTLAWNSHRHLELYYAVPCMGAVLHTANLRLSRDQIAYIINHAEDKILFLDEDLLPLVERLSLDSVRNFVVMLSDPHGTVPTTSLRPAHNYEDLLRSGSAHFEFPELDENMPAGICYTSGTTGEPKGVVYSHRGLSLHSLALCLPDAFALSERDTVMPIVSMFHVNAWGMPYAATMVGAKQVYPGPHPDCKTFAELIQNERVTLTAAVPSVWIAMLAELDRVHYDIGSLRTIASGGAAVPQSLIAAYERKFGVPIVQAWGMTEISPLATVSRLTAAMEDWSEKERLRQRGKQGRLIPGLEMSVVDGQGREIAWDGRQSGELRIRGPWVADRYYKGQQFADGWLHTGDVVTVDEHGFVQIVDRTKDLIKSGGEWISSVALENAIMAHPKVLEAAVIAVAHDRWQERPLACIVPKPEFRNLITKEEILAALRSHLPAWWLPDEIVFIEEVPKTSVGKFDKKVLRERFKNVQL